MTSVIPIIPIHDFSLRKPVNIMAPVLGDATLSGLKNPPPLSLYIHIPWCVKKCPYCDFNSHELSNKNDSEKLPEKRYVAALISDLEQSVPRVYGRKIRSVFFGGGTPSLFSPDAINDILNAVRMLTPLEYDAEVTLEANPSTVESAHFQGYKSAGVNRISLGIQSFNADHLRAIGRVHDDKQAINAAELAMKTFDRVNLDLMYGLPDQSLAQAINDANRAIAFGSDHLSFYHLTLEPNTPFYRTPPSLPSDDLSADMQISIEQLLATNGFEHYETSAFCKPSLLNKNAQAKHNLNYWQFGDYLGIGAGAHSKLSYHDKITRETRHKHPNAYMQNALGNNAVDQMRVIEQKELVFEFMMNALRLNNGFDARLFQQRTGLLIDVMASRLNIALKQSLITYENNFIKPTQLGQRYLNNLLELFL